MAIDSQRKSGTTVWTAQHGGSEEKALDLGAQDDHTKPAYSRSLVAGARAVLKRVTSQFIARLTDPAGGRERPNQT
jgi:DNA-binding response OmpR family regulator